MWKKKTKKWFGIACLLIIACAILGHAVILQSLGGILVCDQSSEKVDVVQPAAGDRVYAAAAELIRSRQASKIVIFESPVGNLERFGILPRTDKLAVSVLQSEGIAPSDVEVVPFAREPTDLPSSRLQRWLKQNPRSRLAILTDQFWSRRLRVQLDRSLSKEERERVFVYALKNRTFDDANWWGTRLGVKSWLVSSLALTHTCLVGVSPLAESVGWDPIAYEEELIKARGIEGR